MTSDPQTRIRSGDAWLRLLLMLIYFCLVYYVVKLLVGISMLFQFGHALVIGERNGRLADFTSDLNEFSYSALQYLTWNSDHRPFPFCDWPAPQRDDDPSNSW